jgi:hypothetical protein
MPVILPPQEAEIRRIRFQSQPQLNSTRDTYLGKIHHKKGPPKMKTMSSVGNQQSYTIFLWGFVNSALKPNQLDEGKLKMYYLWHCSLCRAESLTCGSDAVYREVVLKMD